MDFNEVLTVIFKVVIIPVLPVAVAYLIAYLRAKKEELTNSMNNQVVASVLSEAGDAVMQAVEYVSQTYVDSLKKQGKFDGDAQKVAFAQAKEIALQLLTEDAKQMITDLYGDITVWLDTKIEQTVKEQKTFTLGTAVLEPIREMEA